MPRRALRLLKPGDTRLPSFKVSVLGRGLGRLISPSSPALPAFRYEVWSLTSEPTNDAMIRYHHAMSMIGNQHRRRDVQR